MDQNTGELLLYAKITAMFESLQQNDYTKDVKS